MKQNGPRNRNTVKHRANKREKKLKRTSSCTRETLANEKSPEENIAKDRRSLLRRQHSQQNHPSKHTRVRPKRETYWGSSDFNSSADRNTLESFVAVGRLCWCSAARATPLSHGYKHRSALVCAAAVLERTSLPSLCGGAKGLKGLRLALRV